MGNVNTARTIVRSSDEDFKKLVQVQLTEEVEVGVLSNLSTSDGSELTPEQVVIGDRALGGIVAYFFKDGDTGYVEGEKHGLVIAENELVDQFQWTGDGVNDAGDITPDRTIGAGLTNTNIINDYYSGSTISAAGAAKNYRSGQYNDWFLPSILEFNAIMPAMWSGYTNISRVAEGANDNIYDRKYWTSTTVDAGGGTTIHWGYKTYSDLARIEDWNNGDPGWLGWCGEPAATWWMRVLPFRYF